MAYHIPVAAKLVAAPIVCRVLTMKQYDPDPAIDARIRRAVRYGQTRWAEIWLSVIMLVVGITLLMPWPTFVGPQYRIILSYVTEHTAGLVSVGAGMARLTALYINGRRGRETSFIRTIGCIGGFGFWLTMALGFALAFPPLALSAGIYTVFAIAELHSSGRAAGDMAAEDTFGFRKRRRSSAAGSSAI